MVILFLSHSIYNSEISEFTRNKTGLGMMVREIIENISSLDEPYLLTHAIIKEGKMNNTNIISHTWKNIFCGFSLDYFLMGIHYSLKFKQKFKERLRYIYYYLDAGYIRSIIKKLKPDIVHIHGIRYTTKPYIDVCRELKVPFLVTLHGLIGLNDSVIVAQHEKRLEIDFLKISEKENIPITVISSGIKKRIMKKYGIRPAQNITVINNGTNSVKGDNYFINIRSKYNIEKSKIIILCIGNISIRKNQMQVVEAFHSLSVEWKEKIVVLFLGNPSSSVQLEERINDLGYKCQLICCGFVEEKDIPSYYNEADYNIVASLDEGFGLSIIESFMYGNPTVTFENLDAVPDLYDEKAMILVGNRSNQAFSTAIEKMLEIEWDREYIINYAKQFSLSKMSDEYHKCYRSIIEGKVKL